MILCNRCKKRPAIVFVSHFGSDGKSNEGYCLSCAKQMNIPQVSEYINSMGIDEKDLDDFSDQMMEFMQDTNDDGETMGNIGAMPNFFRNLFSTKMPSMEEIEQSVDPENTEKRKKEKPSKKQKSEEKENKFLNSYCTNLSKRAKEGKLDRIIGRDREISRVIQILSRRQKNNPCLIV